MNLFGWFGKRAREESELDEELRFHLQQETLLRAGRGEPEEAARAAARRDFGNITHAKEVTREMWNWSALDRATNDFRYAARLFRKSPAFTALAVASLALGIGATTAIFSVVDAVLLRPLPLPEPGRLTMVWEQQLRSSHNNVVQTQNFLEWRKRNHSFENIAAFMPIAVNVEGGDGAVQVPGVRVTAGFFETWGVRPMWGRPIRADDDVPGAPCVTVLSFGFWQRRFGGASGLPAERLIAGGVPCEVVGVMPQGFAMPTCPHADLYQPMKINPARAPRDGRNYSVVARLRAGVSVEQAGSDMRAIAAQTAEERPAMNARWSASVVPLLEQTVGPSRDALLVLLGAALCVLLIACANVCNLLLVRASKRRREMNVRIALGAGRWRLIRQLLAESLLLAGTGGLGGFLLALWGVPAMIGMLPADFPLPRREEIAVNPAMLLFTMAVSLTCGVFFGILPALQAGRDRVSEGLRQGGRTGSAGHRGWRNLLVVAEVAIAMLLVIGAGLMVRSYALMNANAPGFRPERVISIRMILFGNSPDLQRLLARRAQVTAQMLERIRQLPAVASASSIHILPMTGTNSGTGYYRADRPAPLPGSMEGGDVSIVSDDYFGTMGIHMEAGREFNLRDSAGAPLVAVLNQTAARKIFAGENPIGKRMRVEWGTGAGPMGIEITEVEIVGVSADILHWGLTAKPEPCLFMPQAQQPNGLLSLLVRTSADPTGVVVAVKEQIHAVSPSQGIQDVRTMEEIMASSVARPKLDAAVMAVFGVIALALACLGIYAVISYSVEQRMREMGIRLALGASPSGVLGMVLREGLLLAVVGIAAGAAAALGLTRYLASLLYAVKPADPAVFASVAAILAMAAVAGCYIPARRATRVNPVVVLREE